MHRTGFRPNAGSIVHGRSRVEIGREGIRAPTRVQVIADAVLVGVACAFDEIGIWLLNPLPFKAGLARQGNVRQLTDGEACPAARALGIASSRQGCLLGQADLARNQEGKQQECLHGRRSED